MEEALAAHAAGADAVIAQGVEAGGHVRGETPALELLERVRAALPRTIRCCSPAASPTRRTCSAALDAGAAAAVLGTRFLLTEESGAHAEYKRRALDGSRDPAHPSCSAPAGPPPHRVLPNAATERWLGDDPAGPGWVRRLHRVTAPALSRAPDAVIARAAALQRPGSPMLGPQPPVEGGPPGLLDAGPLYAGETVARITELRPAGELDARAWRATPSSSTTSQHEQGHAHHRRGDLQRPLARPEVRVGSVAAVEALGRLAHPVVVVIPVRAAVGHGRGKSVPETRKPTSGWSVSRVKAYPSPPLGRFLTLGR